MSDEHMITKLRSAAAEGPPATAASVAIIAARGHRLRRRRQAVAAGTATLSVVAVAVLALNFPGNAGQSVVQTTTPATGGGASTAPAGLNRATGPSDDEAELQRRRASNLARLREVLGTSAWVNSPPPLDSLVLAPGAAAARDLPGGDRAQASIEVHFQPPQAAGCPTQVPGGALVVSCTVVPTADSGSATIERFSYRAGSPKAGDFTRVTYLRPDGATAKAELMVFSPSTVETDARDQRARVWLQRYDDLLVQAAADPTMQRDPGPPWSPDAAVPTPSPAKTPACSPDALRLESGPVVSDGAERVILVVLRNTSAATCLVPAHVTVTLLDAQHAAVPFRYHYSVGRLANGDPLPPVRLAPGDLTYSRLSKKPCTDGDDQRAVTVSVQLPGDRGAKELTLPQQLDLGWCGQGDPGSTVTVGPMDAPVKAVPAH